MRTIASSIGEGVARSAASALLIDDGLLPSLPGLYGLVLDNGLDVLARTGVVVGAPQPPAVAEGLLVHIGCTHRLTLRERVMHHVLGSSRRSSFRRTLGCLLREEASLQPHGRPGEHDFRFTDPGERWLTEFLRRHLAVLWVPMPDPRGAEHWLIKAVKPPLNIKGLESSPSAKALLELRWRTSLLATLAA